MSPRPLKFRVWDETKKRMFWPLGQLIGCNEPEYGYPQVLHEFKVRDYGFNLCKEGFSEGYLIIQQFTGHQDKNLKDIYEGDFINLDKVTYQIEWRGLGFVGLDILTEESYQLDENLLGNFVIVGNIKENPEIIEKKYVKY